MNDILEIMIPSETVRKHVLDTGWKFTDKEKGALLQRRYCDLLLQDLYSYLRHLRDITTDEELREQITTYLEYEEQAIQTFKENGDRRCVYILKVREDGGSWDGEYLPHGYFFDWETAFEFGKREKTLFNIEKYLIDEVCEFDDGTCYQNWISELRFDKDGGMICVSSREIPCIEQDNHHFTEMYFEVPNPFEQGDIIKTRGGYYGIVETSQEDWKKDVARHKEMVQHGNRSTDCTDIRISVAIFCEEYGTFNIGDDYTPLDFERYQPESTGNDASALRDRILMCRSLVDRGQSSFDELYSLTMEYRKMREKTDKEEQEKKALLTAFGTNQWLTYMELREKLRADYGEDGDSILSNLNWLMYKGHIQYARPHGTDDYYCGLG